MEGCENAHRDSATAFSIPSFCTKDAVCRGKCSDLGGIVSFVHQLRHHDLSPTSTGGRVPVEYTCQAVPVFAWRIPHQDWQGPPLVWVSGRMWTHSMRHSPCEPAVLHGGRGPRRRLGLKKEWCPALHRWQWVSAQQRATATHALGYDEELPSEVLTMYSTNK